MIKSTVLALLLFSQSINIGRCLRANGTHEISEVARQYRPRRSLTFPDPSMLLAYGRKGVPNTLCNVTILCGNLRFYRKFIRGGGPRESRHGNWMNFVRFTEFGIHDEWPWTIAIHPHCIYNAAYLYTPPLIFGLGTPLQLDRESVIVGVFAKMWYAMPSNATDFTEPGVYYTRGSRSRWSFYKMFEKVAAMYGFGGKECLLRAICEVAYVPFDVHHGLLGQLVQTFLRPSSTREEYDEYGDREYRAAERLGEQAEGAGCHALYPECRRSVLDVFSTLTA